MVNGITWEEETQARITDAKEKKEKALATVNQAQIEANHWGEYAETLEKALKLHRQSPGINQEGQFKLNSEHLRQQSTWDSLCEITAPNKHILVVTEGVTTLVNAKMFNDREHARNVIYSTLYSHQKDIQKIRPGVYQLKVVRSNKDSETTKLKEPTSHILKKRNRKTSGLGKAIKELKENNPQLTRDEILNILIQKGFDFGDKKPFSAVNMAWVKLGYSRKQIQQSLPLD